MDKLKQFIKTVLKEAEEQSELDKALEDKTVKNPDTGREIKVRTASSNEDHPAYDAAKRIIDREKDKISDRKNK